MITLTEILNNPEEHYPGNFDTPQRANALLTGLCQDAAIEIERLNKALADEREACAKVCDDHATKDGFEGCYANACAESIRARGNT